MTEESGLTRMMIGTAIAVVGIVIVSNIYSGWVKGRSQPIEYNDNGNDNDNDFVDNGPGYDESDLSVDRIVVILPTIELGNEVAILAKISRPVATSGFVSYTIMCRINGEELYSELIFFPGYYVGNVWFNYIPQERGVYNVVILDRSAIFEVV